MKKPVRAAMESHQARPPPWTWRGALLACSLCLILAPWPAHGSAGSITTTHATVDIELDSGLSREGQPSGAPSAPTPLPQVQASAHCPRGDPDGAVLRCTCYQFEDGLFLECPNAGLETVKKSLAAVSSPIKSYTIYHLEPNISSLPGQLFGNSSIEKLRVVYSNVSSIPSEAFGGLETSLRALGFVNSRLATVPQSALSGLKALQSLDLDGNEISELDSYAFYGQPLVHLNLQGNRVSSLLEYAFGGLETTLEELVLINNRLESFPLVALRRLRKLRSLQLRGNKISEIPDDGFTRFAALANLDLGNNLLRNLDDRSFVFMPKLVSLSLAYNKLSVIDDKVFVHLPELETLDLSRNSLRVLNGAVFAALLKVRTIDLSHNHLHFLEMGTFHNLPSLRELFLTRNNVLKLANGTFYNTTLISALFLEHNAISEMESGVFSDLRHLSQLHLSFNQIRDLRNLFKSNVLLRSLSLDNNLIADIMPGCFQDLVELRDLRLQNNALTRIRKGAFYSFPDLQELNLQNNRIESIDADALQSLASLQVLSIQGNRLREMGEVLNRHQSNLRYLQLSHNDIVSVRNASLRGQSDIEAIWFDHNKLKKITKSMFADLRQVQKLYLEHNDVNVIESSSFSSLKNLLFLNLEHNQLNHLSGDTFAGAESLETLLLAHNQIAAIEMNCFSALPQLKTLHLSHNQISVLRKYMFEGLKLEELHIAESGVEEIEALTFAGLPIEVLDLSGNRLDAHAIDLASLPATLRLLLLSSSNFTSQSARIFHGLSQLEELDLSATGAGFNLTVSDGQPLAAVRVLKLSQNDLSEVPPASALTTMPTLEQLDLSGNSIKRVAMGSFENSSLRVLNISNNSLSVLDAGAFLSLESSLQQLDLSNNVIRSIGAGVLEELAALESLSVENNWFQYIPNSIVRAELPRLKFLTLRRNPLLRVREDASISGGFPSLEHLVLSDGNLSVTASHDFFAMSKLVSLSLRNNHISKISPGSFRPLLKLATLDLAHNEIRTLPEERLSALNNLLTLNLSGNLLQDIPAFSLDLVSLREVDLSSNRISKVDTFGHLGESLQFVSVKDNIIGWVAANAFQNLTSLERLDLRNNFVTHLNDALFTPIEVSLESLLLAGKCPPSVMCRDVFTNEFCGTGNPFHCDCRLLSLWEWLQDHARLLYTEEHRANEILCIQSDKLSHAVLGLHPVEFCPVPLISLLVINSTSATEIAIRWTVQNDSLVGGFSLDIHLTSDRSQVLPNLKLASQERVSHIKNLIPETEYTLCVQANGRYLKMASSRPTPYVVGLERSYGEYVTSNRKCVQVRAQAYHEHVSHLQPYPSSRASLNYLLLSRPSTHLHHVY